MVRTTFPAAVNCRSSYIPVINVALIARIAGRKIL